MECPNRETASDVRDPVCLWSAPRSFALLLAYLSVCIGLPEPTLADLWSDPTGPGGTDPFTKGWWDSNTGTGYAINVDDVDFAPVHGTLLPYGDLGKLVLFNTRRQGIASFDLNGTPGSATRFATCDDDTNCTVLRQEYFCSGHTVLSTGDLLVLGGHWGDKVRTGPRRYIPSPPWASYFDVDTDELIEITPMLGKARFYPTCTVLPSGDILTWGGDYWVDSNGDSLINDPKIDTTSWIQFHMEGDDPAYGTWSEVPNLLGTGSILERVQLYPYTQLIPDSPTMDEDLDAGGLSWVGPFSSGAAGTDTNSVFFPFDGGQADSVRDRRKRLWRSACAMVLLQLAMPNPSPRILLLGGGLETEETVDVTSSAEIWNSTLASGNRWSFADSMSVERHDLDAVLLPNGHVFVVGGHSSEGSCYQNPGGVCPLECETFDPEAALTEQWTESDAVAVKREYHSVALLLPDARVIVAGGEDRDETEASTYEIYYPPYLFKDVGGSAVIRGATDRPIIDSIEEHGLPGSKEIFYSGSTFDIEVSGDVDPAACEVVLMRPCSVTHSNDMSQRSLLLQSEQAGSDIRVTVSFDEKDAPPGPYMVFVLNDEGIPSKAKWIFIKEGTPITNPGGGSRTWSSGITDVTEDEIIAVDDTLYVEAGAIVKMAADDNPDGGKDHDKVEVVVYGVLRILADASDPAVLRANFSSMNDHWYGIRVTETGQIIFDHPGGLEIKNARAAIAWERTDLPDLEALADNVTFTDDFVNISFDRDVVVPVNEERTIPPGWTLGFEPGDLSGGGEDSQLGEMIVAGRLLAEGTVSERIEIKSAAKGDPQHYYGVRLLDSGDSTLSSLKHVDFDYATFAVSVDSVSGNLFDLKFSNSDKGDLYLPGDTRIPAGSEWNLLAPTKVVAANSDAYERGEDSLRVEVVVNGGDLFTSSAGGGRVQFTSETADTDGKAWHGVTVQGSGRAVILDAEFTYAIYPFTGLLADSVVVKDSWFHHYNQEAITDWGSDATIENNDVWRGMNELTSAGYVGIHIATSFGLVKGNRVFAQKKRGIWADFSQGYCLGPPVTPPPTGKLLTIDDNDVIGTPTNNFAGSYGIDVSWACHEQEVIVQNCNVQNWFDDGIRVRQSGDVRIECNCVMGNDVGFFHRMDKVSFDDEGYNRLSECLLKDNEYANCLVKEGPTVASSGLYGGWENDTGSSGGNLMKQFLDGTYNWVTVDDDDETRVDLAETNAWRDHEDDPLVTENDIEAENLVQGEGSTDVTPFEDGSYSISCVVDSVDCVIPSPPSGSRGMQPKHVGEEWDEQATEAPALPIESLGLPQVLAFHQPRPNPTRGRVTLQLDLPLENEGFVSVKVFDVTGRRVKTMQDGPLPAGRHSLVWLLRDDRGKVVSSGIYFARMVIGDRSVVRRVVVLH